MKSRYLFLFLVAILSLPLQLWAQNEVLSVPLQNIQPYDPFQPLQQMYCDTRGNSLGTNLQEWQVPSNLRWDDPNRDRSHVCWVDCNGQIHCNTSCSDAFTSGCAGSSNPVNWYVNDVLVGTEPGGSFNDGTNTTWFGTDDPTNHRVNLHVNSTGGGSGACSVGSVEDGYVCAGPPLLAPLAPPILDKAFAYSPGTGLTTISATLPQPVNVGDQILVGCLVDAYPSPGGSCLPSGSASSLTDSMHDTYSLIGPAHALVYTNVQFAIATVGTAGSMTVTMAGLSSSNAYELAIFRTYNVGGFDTYASGGGSYTNTATANITTTSAGDLLIGVGAQLSGFAYGPLMIYQNSGNWAELGISTPLLSYGEGWGFSGTYQSAAGANSLTWSSTPSSGLGAGMGVGIFAFSPGGAWPSTGPPTFRSLYATDIPTTLWLTDLDILPTLFLYLPACTSGSLGTEGTIRSVTDSTTATQGAIITGGGTNHVQAYCNGTNWVVTSGTGGGGSVELQTIGTDNSSQVLLNFIASTTNTLGLINTPANPSGGEEKIEVTGATGLTSDEGKLLGVNSAGTVGLNAPSAYSIPLYTGSVTPGHCAEWSASSPPTLEDSSGACGGSGGSVELQTIGTDNSSQVLLNFIASTTNTLGLINTPANPSGGEEKIEVTGATGLTADEGQLLGVNSAGTVGLNAPSAYSIPLYTGSVTPGHCAEWSASSPPTLEDSSGACGGGSGTVNSAAQYALASYLTAGTAVSGIAAPATIGKFFWGHSNSSAAATEAQPIQIGNTAREVTGSTDTITEADCAAGTINYKTAASVAVALGTPASLSNTGCAFSVASTFDGTNTPPSVTFTAGGSYHFSVNGGALASTLTVASGQYAFIYPDQTETAQWDVLYPGAISVSSSAIHACVIDNDTQSATALVAANFSGRCEIPAASTIVEVDVAGGTGVLTGTPAAPTVTGTGSASGQACALPTAGSATCGIMGITQAGSSLSITTTALNAGDVLYVSAATPDAAQTWYTVTIFYQ
jgi:hypothetical protein